MAPFRSLIQPMVAGNRAMSTGQKYSDFRIARSAICQYFIRFCARFCVLCTFYKTGFDHCIPYAEVNHITTYGSFLRSTNAKIDVTKETDRYKHNIVICGIVICGLHCILNHTHISSIQLSTIAYLPLDFFIRFVMVRLENPGSLTLRYLRLTSPEYKH